MSEIINVPKSIGIIMDGNRRWAKNKNLPTKFGHQEGAEAVKRVCKAANELGVKFITLYAFSTENWNRDPEEVEQIMSLFNRFLDECIEKMSTEDNLKIRFIGDRTRIKDELAAKMNSIEEKTASYEGLTVTIAINYGGRDEITRAVKKIINDNVKVEDVNIELISSYLDTYPSLDPDLIIRTSGELRISNFMIWQAAYSEYYFTDKYWPEFSKDDLIKAIESYNSRSRRFGGK